jgi:hypothetical protein
MFRDGEVFRDDNPARAQVSNVAQPKNMVLSGDARSQFKPAATAADIKMVDFSGNPRRSVRATVSCCPKMYQSCRMA